MESHKNFGDEVHSENRNSCANGNRQPWRDINFDDYIRRPEEFGKNCDKEESTRCEGGHAESHSDNPNFEDGIRQPERWGNRAGTNFDDYIRKPPDFENSCNSTEGNFEDGIRQPKEWEVTNFLGNRNEDENSDLRSRIIFPDDELLKDIENDSERKRENEDDGKIVFPDD
ncbi:hypothetical protein Trydic_g17716 [Trypoxylus dichotomus]